MNIIIILDSSCVHVTYLFGLMFAQREFSLENKLIIIVHNVFSFIHTSLAMLLRDVQWHRIVDPVKNEIANFLWQPR